MFWVACVILWQLSCCVLTMNPRNPMPQLTSLQKEAFELQGLSVLCKALWNPQMKDIAEMSLFVFFLIEQTIQKRSRASLGGLLCEALCLWSHRTRTNMWQGALCSFTFDSTAGDTQWYSACWGSAPQSIRKVKVFLCHLFLAWSLPCCGAFLWSVKWEQLGSPAAVTGIPLMVFQRCQAGEVYQSHGEVAVQRCCWRNELMLLSPLPAHRPFHLFRFRAKRWKWSQCRCLQDVAWRQRTI